MAQGAKDFCGKRYSAGMDYFAAMKAFVRSVELGSFSKAAAEAGIKVSTVSRYVTSLEDDLGAALFNRSTRHNHLTEAGKIFYDRQRPSWRNSSKRAMKPHRSTRSRRGFCASTSPAPSAAGM
jgi:DNA-binding transcriptional LysR family regulator